MSINTKKFIFKLSQIYGEGKFFSAYPSFSHSSSDEAKMSALEFWVDELKIFSEEHFIIFFEELKKERSDFFHEDFKKFVPTLAQIYDVLKKIKSRINYERENNDKRKPLKDSDFHKTSDSQFISNIKKLSSMGAMGKIISVNLIKNRASYFKIDEKKLFKDCGL